MKMETRQIKIFIFILSVLAVNSGRKDGMVLTPAQLQFLNFHSETRPDFSWPKGETKPTEIPYIFEAGHDSPVYKGKIIAAIEFLNTKLKDCIQIR